MGKSLVIKGADFSANGMHIDTLVGSVDITNTSDVGINFDCAKTFLDSLSGDVTGNKVKLFVSCEDASVNSILNGQELKYVSAVSGFPIIGTSNWGEAFEIDYPVAATVIIQTVLSSYSGLNNKAFKISVYQ